MQQALVEAEVAHTVADLAALHQEGSIASHAGQYLFVRLDFADIPQTRHQHPTLGGGDHLLDGSRIFRHSENDVHRGLSHFVGERKAVTSGLDPSNLLFVFGSLHLLCGGSCVDQLLDNSILDQMHPLAADPFAIKRRAGLQRMADVVNDVYVVAEDFRAHPVVKK